MKLYAATGKSIARLEQADGDVWHAETVLAEPGLVCVTADPVRPGTLYAGSEGNGVWKSADGTNWQKTALNEPNVLSVAVSPADGAIYAGTEPSMLFVSRDEGASWHELEALRRIPSAPTWSFPPKPWTSHVRWIAPNPHYPALLLAGIELGGVMRSSDGGVTWEDHRPGAQRDAHALAWHPVATGRAYEAGGGGAAWSKNGGETWQPADAGRDRHYTWALAVDPNDPDCWFVSASTGPRDAHYTQSMQGRLYRWRGAGPWQLLDGGLPRDSMVYALASVPGQLFAALRDGRIYRTNDSGDHWQPLAVQGERLEHIKALAYAA